MCVISIIFDVFFAPDPIACPLRLIAAEAIRLNAFKDDFASAEELFSKPQLGKTDYIQLQWKDPIKKQRVFPVPYVALNSGWHKLCLVAGFRIPPVLYAHRVGAQLRVVQNCKCFSFYFDRSWLKIYCRPVLVR
jgi:hypothetical protein